MSNNLYNNITPANIRLFLSSFGNNSPVNEKFFTQQEIKILQDAYRNSLNKNRNSIQYEDYPYGSSSNHSPFGNVPQMIVDSLQDKSYALSNTIGRANYYKDKYGNVHVKDIYDFNNSANHPDEAYGWSPTFRALHNLGNKKIKPRQIDINIGKF